LSFLPSSGKAPWFSFLIQRLSAAGLAHCGFRESFLASLTTPILFRWKRKRFFYSFRLRQKCATSKPPQDISREQNSERKGGLPFNGGRVFRLEARKPVCGSDGGLSGVRPRVGEISLRRDFDPLIPLPSKHGNIVALACSSEDPSSTLETREGAQHPSSQIAFSTFFHFRRFDQ